MFPGFCFYFHFYIWTKCLHALFFIPNILRQIFTNSPQTALQELTLFSNWHLCKGVWVPFLYWGKLTAGPVKLLKNTPSSTIDLHFYINERHTLQFMPYMSINNNNFLILQVFGVVIRRIMNTVTFILYGIFDLIINTVQNDCRECCPEGCFAQDVHCWSMFLGSPLDCVHLKIYRFIFSDKRGFFFFI